VKSDDVYTGWPDGLMRPLTIVWPDRDRPLHPVEIMFFEFPSGEPIYSVTDMVLRASAGNAPVTAELTMIIGADDLPVLGDMRCLPPGSVHADGSPRTGVFLWSVVGMRTRS
jgi:hypothetical protein